jgi:fibro-slime domain-containing protein
VRAEEPESVSLPVVFRDFRGKDLTNGHPDFEGAVAAEKGLVSAQLAGSPGKPALADPSGASSSTIQNSASFEQWYRDVAGVNVTLVDVLTLDRKAAGTYVFDDQDFFPLDGRGFNGLPMSDPLFEKARTGGHNFHFTSEVRYWFEYRGDEVLEFRGDDDVWVFINGRLAVDLGGVHGAQSASVTLSEKASELGLSESGIYEAVVFQAERHTSESSYKLTLTNFLTERTECSGVCGNGVKTLGEQCDDGNVVDGDGCSADCKLEGVNVL